MSTIAQREEITVRGIRFLLVEMERRWPGRRDIFVLRLRDGGIFQEEFSGFRSFFAAKEFLHVSVEVAEWAGYHASEAPKDRVIEAVGSVKWNEQGGVDEEGFEFGERGGSDPFSGKIRWLAREGWSGWVWADTNIGIGSGIDDRIRIARWAEVAA